MAGCAVDQTQEVETYRSVLGEPPVIEPGATLTLDQALRLTGSQNERLSTVGEDYLQALIERQRRVSRLIPTLSAFGDLTVRENTASSGSTVFDAGVGAQYELLTGFTDFKRVTSADLTIEQRRWLLLDVREGLLLESANAYYGVLLGERRVQVLESSLKVQEERLRDIRGRQAVGFARPLDVAQIEAQTSETRVTLLDAQNQVANARSGLSLLTGVDCSTRELGDAFSPPSGLPELNAMVALAEQRRQDLAAAAAEAGARRLEVDAEIGRYAPSIGVNLDYFLVRESSPEDLNWTGLLRVNIPIFTAGRIDADVREAWSLFRQAVIQHSLIRREIRRDVEVARADLIATRARLEETGKQVVAAEEALRQAEAAYGAGLGTNLERITAQDELLSAQLRRAQEEFSEKFAYLAAMRALGLLSAGLDGARLDAPGEATEMAREVPESAFVVIPGRRSTGG